MAFLCRLYDLFSGGLRPSHSDIFRYTSTLQPCFLQYHSIIFSKTLSGHIFVFLTRNHNLAFIYIIKAHQQVDQCGLAAACRSYDGDSLARFYIQSKVLNEFFLWIIGKTYILQRYTSVHFIQCFHSFFHFSRLFDQFQKPSRAGNGILQFCYHPGYFIKWFSILVCVT